MAETEALRASPATASAGSKGRILIVDDDAQVLTALCQTLADWGYETRGCSAGPEALTLLRQADYDVLLCDLMMPAMDGITLLREANDLAPDLIGIIMTGQSSVPTAVEALRAGAFDYVLKPLRLSTLQPVLLRALEVCRLRTENMQLRETVAMCELSMAVAFSLDAHIILHKTADAALQACQADEASIMLPTQDSKELYVAVVRGGNREHLLGRSSPFTQGVAGWVASHQEPLLLQGAVEDPRFTPVYPRNDIRSALSIPMLTGGRLVGVLNVNATKRLRPFTPGEMKTVTLLANIAAPALVTTQLYQQLREAREELERRVQERTAALSRVNQALHGEIAERKRAEKALQDREEYLRALIENASDVVAVVNGDGAVRYSSPSLERVLGYKPHEILGADSFTLLHADEVPRMQDVFARLLLSPGIPFVAELQVRHKDGSLRVLETVGTNLLDTPAVAGVVFNSRDITERKEGERLKEEMISVVSHELRTPLTSLRGFAELLLNRDFPPDKQREFLAILHSEVLRLSNLANDFLDIQRLQAGHTVYHFASTALAPLIRESVAAFAPAGGEHPIRLDMPDSLPPVPADADRIRQVLTNLLSNAVKFSPGGGEVVSGRARTANRSGCGWQTRGWEFRPRPSPSSSANSTASSTTRRATLGGRDWG
jgi:PAS domain S-box-containing protein